MVIKKNCEPSNRFTLKIKKNTCIQILQTSKCKLSKLTRTDQNQGNTFIRFQNNLITTTKSY